LEDPARLATERRRRRTRIVTAGPRGDTISVSCFFPVEKRTDTDCPLKEQRADWKLKIKIRMRITIRKRMKSKIKIKSRILCTSLRSDALITKSTTRRIGLNLALAPNLLRNPNLHLHLTLLKTRSPLCCRSRNRRSKSPDSGYADL